MRATIPPDVPAQIGVDCNLRAIVLTLHRPVAADIRFEEQAALLYVCIGQKMGPGWGGQRASRADIDRLTGLVHVADPAFTLSLMDSSKPEPHIIFQRR
jgi:hypothetical protein